MDSPTDPLGPDDAFTIIQKLRLELEKETEGDACGVHKHSPSQDQSTCPDRPDLVPFFIPSAKTCKNTDVCPHCEEQWGKEREFLHHRISSLKEKLSIAQDEAAHAKKDHTTVLARLKVKTSQLQKMEEMCTKYHHSFHLQDLEMRSLRSQLESLKQASQLVQTQRDAEGEQLASIHIIRDKIEEECVAIRTDLTKRIEEVENLHKILTQTKAENAKLREVIKCLEKDCVQNAVSSEKLREGVAKKTHELMVAISQSEKIARDLDMAKREVTEKNAEILKLQELLLCVSTTSSECDGGGCTGFPINTSDPSTLDQSTSLSDVPQ
eukprot:TRINITY_DN508_c0_g1_i5.p1 TRINITY_DN508_c0_g1~~TRINITY_DN508_c0_g1_i5.p1  ORF type:complete len:324 (-),score=94.16 TRINITY_DN508_c0_g1_i5:130-1101(-)